MKYTKKCQAHRPCYHPSGPFKSFVFLVVNNYFNSIKKPSGLVKKKLQMLIELAPVRDIYQSHKDVFPSLGSNNSCRRVVLSCQEIVALRNWNVRFFLIVSESKLSNEISVGISEGSIFEEDLIPSI